MLYQFVLQRYKLCEIACLLLNLLQVDPHVCIMQDWLCSESDSLISKHTNLHLLQEGQVYELKLPFHLSYSFSVVPQLFLEFSFLDELRELINYLISLV